jgi:hypothetical protein
MAVSVETPLLFVHIPKTAGMSMFRSMTEQFAGHVADMYNISFAWPQKALDYAKDTNISVYCGHYCFGYHEWLNRPAHYMTVLRHPVDRVLSLYLYVGQYRRSFGQRAKHLGVSLREFLTRDGSPDFYAEYLPWMEGKDTLRTFLSCPSTALDNDMVRHLSGFGMKDERCPPEALAQAKKNIEQCFSVVGIQEQYDQTLDLMRKVFDWSWLKPSEVNKTRDKSKYNGAARDFIAQANPLDMALYDWVAERFEKHKSHAPAPVLVEGQNRMDSPAPVLYRAVGSSPWREAAAKGEKFVPPPGMRRGGPGGMGGPRGPGGMGGPRGPGGMGGPGGPRGPGGMGGPQGPGR